MTPAMDLARRIGVSSVEDPKAVGLESARSAQQEAIALVLMVQARLARPVPPTVERGVDSGAPGQQLRTDHVPPRAAGRAAGSAPPG